jgi:transposase
MKRGDLEKLSKQELVEAYLALQSGLARPAKTSRTSSKPPSTDRKARRLQSKPGGAKPGHEGHNRSLHGSPDEMFDHRLEVCPQCNAALGADLQGDVIGEYDEIDLPPIAPLVRRHRRMCVCCPQCRARVKGALPAAANGSPFGPRLHALVLYLKTFQAVSFARLEGMLGEVFGLKVSQGALANMLRRSQQPFAASKRRLVDNLRQADVVASDETGIRIEGSNGYHWVFLSDRAVVHEVQLSRAAQVVRDVLLSDAVHRLPGEGWAITARKSGSQTAIQRNKSMDTTTRPAWHI